MKRFLIPAAAALAMLAGAAHAQTATPRQIQDLIASGQANTALADLQNVLQIHPKSGEAWYLSAEAEDALGNESAARGDLARAEQYAPGLPFANQSDVAALQSHLNGQATGGRGIGLIPIAIGGFVALFLLLRLFGRRRVMPAAYGAYPGQTGYGSGYGPGGMPYGPGGGGGVGSSLLSGLAAGAGFAAGERIIDDLSGNRGFDQNQGFDQGQAPDRDDGLNGSPGWDDGGGNNDPGNNW